MTPEQRQVFAEFRRGIVRPPQEAYLAAITAYAGGCTSPAPPEITHRSHVIRMYPGRRLAGYLEAAAHARQKTWNWGVRTARINRKLRRYLRASDLTGIRAVDPAKPCPAWALGPVARHPLVARKLRRYLRGSDLTGIRPVDPAKPCPAWALGPVARHPLVARKLTAYDLQRLWVIDRPKILPRWSTIISSITNKTLIELGDAYNAFEGKKKNGKKREDRAGRPKYRGVSERLSFRADGGWNPRTSRPIGVRITGRRITFGAAKGASDTQRRVLAHGCRLAEDFRFWEVAVKLARVNVTRKSRKWYTSIAAELRPLTPTRTQRPRPIMGVDPGVSKELVAVADTAGKKIIIWDNERYFRSHNAKLAELQRLESRTKRHKICEHCRGRIPLQKTPTPTPQVKVKPRKRSDRAADWTPDARQDRRRGREGRPTTKHPHGRYARKRPPVRPPITCSCDTPSPLKKRYVRRGKRGKDPYIYVDSIAKINAKIAIKRLLERIANLRRDRLEKIATEIVAKAGMIVIETLSIRGMARSRRLGKSVHDAAPGELLALLKHKAAAAGVPLIQAPREYPSSKLCSHCGHRYAALKQEERKWICQECGAAHHRDVNAAVNLARLGAVVALGVEGFAGEHSCSVAGQPAVSPGMVDWCNPIDLTPSGKHSPEAPSRQPVPTGRNQQADPPAGQTVPVPVGTQHLSVSASLADPLVSH